MRILLFVLFLITAMPAGAALTRWDALPALDVLHLQGAYAGQQVCPMCRHGYDAGLLVVLPSVTSATDGARIADALHATAERIDDARFRVFLLLAGEAPAPALLAALRRPAPWWYVAQLPPAAVAAASRDYGTALDDGMHGYAFAQRRLLWTFDPGATLADWQPMLDSVADGSMRFLAAHHPDAVASDDPDTPRGQLWAAPAKLATHVETPVGRPGKRVCFTDDNNVARRDALVGIAADARTLWARTDADGCLMLHGAQPAALNVQLFDIVLPAAVATIDTAALPPGATLRVHAVSTAPRISGHEPVIGPCEGCEAVFAGLPPHPAATAQLAPPDEPGERLVLSGTVRDANGTAAPHIVVYAYQTDATGTYPPDAQLTGEAARHGRLRAWARTDAAGGYTFHTIRPGGYPGTTTPQHIHLHIVEPGRCTYFIGDVLFTDDARLTPALRAREQHAQGGNGIVQPQHDGHGGWAATRDIVLGLNVPGYEACASPRI